MMARQARTKCCTTLSVTWTLRRPASAISAEAEILGAGNPPELLSDRFWRRACAPAPCADIAIWAVPGRACFPTGSDDAPGARVRLQASVERAESCPSCSGGWKRESCRSADEQPQPFRDAFFFPGSRHKKHICWPSSSCWPTSRKHTASSVGSSRARGRLSCGYIGLNAARALCLRQQRWR